MISGSYAEINYTLKNKVQSLVYPFLLLSFLNKNFFNVYFYRWSHYNSLRNIFSSVVIKKKIKHDTNIVLSDKRASTLSLISRFINFLIKKGLKIRYVSTLNKSITRLYFMFFFFNKTLGLDNKYYRDMFLIVPNFLNFYNFQTILFFFNSLLEPFFYMRVKKVEKKYRKKLKKKFTIQPIYVKPKKRSSFVLRSIVNYTNLFSSYSFSERLFLAVFKSFTEQKNSFLYKRKLFMYSKLFKNNQKKVF